MHVDGEQRTSLASYRSYWLYENDLLALDLEWRLRPKSYFALNQAFLPRDLKSTEHKLILHAPLNHRG